MGELTRVALGIVALGLIATAIVNGANTAKVINAVTGGFAGDLSAAERG